MKFMHGIHIVEYIGIHIKMITVIHIIKHKY